MTGVIDYLSDGERVIAVENGHPYLGQVTGVCCPGASLIEQRADTSLDRMRHRHHLGLLPHSPSLRQALGRALGYLDVRNRRGERRGQRIRPGPRQLRPGLPGRTIRNPHRHNQRQQQLVH